MTQDRPSARAIRSLDQVQQRRPESPFADVMAKFPDVAAAAQMIAVVTAADGVAL
ncbi:hypothetical protein [Nocardia asiatica]|uniref:hypothetical protein n=1 Tax=Nocardia asiatica TaxID=209252 RepID=UPI0002E7A716|nr:hypothetical protein [Nocardia asiatica]